MALALVLLIAIAAPALAASQTMITTSSVQVRSTPHQHSGNVLGTLDKNSIVNKTGTTGAWTIIDYQGTTAYVLTSHLNNYYGSNYSGSSSSYLPTSGSTVYTTGTATIYKGPGTNYAVLTQLGSGQPVVKVGTTGGWTIIQWNDQTAYVLSSLLSNYSSGGSSSTSTSGTLMKATSNVNVRSGPGTGHAIVGWLAKGETITKLGTSGKWTIVKYGGQTCYVSSNYLKATSGSSSSSSSSNTTSQTLLAARVPTTVYSGPSTANRAIGYLDVGQTVIYLDAIGNWYKVQYGANIAYVYIPDMRVVGASDPVYTASGYVYAYNSVRVYSSANTSSSTLGYLYAGDYAPRTGTTGSFTRITFNGVTGYVVTAQISTSNTYGYGHGYGYSSVGAYMYSRYTGANCYTSPVESNSYYHGRLSLNEQVWAVESNGTWTKIQVGGYTVYTLSSNLAYYGSGYNNYSPNYYGNGYAYVYGANAQLYSNTALSTPVTDINGTRVIAAMNSSVEVLSYLPGDTYVYVRVTSLSQGVAGSYVGYLPKSQLGTVYYY